MEFKRGNLQNLLLDGQGSIVLIDAWVGTGKQGLAFFYVFVSIPNWELFGILLLDSYFVLLQ